MRLEHVLNFATVALVALAGAAHPAWADPAPPAQAAPEAAPPSAPAPGPDSGPSNAPPGNAPAPAPPTPAPTTQVPPPPAALPPPPSQDTAAAPPASEAPATAGQAPPPGAAPPAPAAVAPGPGGQWVYTSQYGWIWAPYGRTYTYVDQPGELAFSYVFYPTFGWRWLASPWVLGWGPSPYWGGVGVGYYAWYAHPWFRAGIYRPVVWNRWAVRPAYVRPYAAPVYAHPHYGYGAGRAWGHGGFGGHHR